MQERSVVFYAIESDFLSIAVKSVEKLYAANKKGLILCDTDEEVRRFDSTLWTFSKTSFIPHGSRYSMKIEDAIFCHTWISTKIDLYNDPICLIHNGLDILAQDLQKFSVIIDIFDKDLLPNSKKRSEFYKESQFLHQKLWIQKKGGSGNSGDEQ